MLNDDSGPNQDEINILIKTDMKPIFRRDENKNTQQEKKVYAWRKDMEEYEAEWEKIRARSSSRTRGSSYQVGQEDMNNKSMRVSTPIKIDIKPSRDYEYKKETVSNLKKNFVDQKYATLAIEKPTYNIEVPAKKKPKAWRKEIERYEDDLELQKLHKDTQRKVDLYESSCREDMKLSEIKTPSSILEENNKEEKVAMRKIPVKVVKTDMNYEKEQGFRKVTTPLATYNCSESFEFDKRNSQLQHKEDKCRKADEALSVTINLNSFAKTVESTTIDKVKKQNVPNSVNLEKDHDDNSFEKSNKVRMQDSPSETETQSDGISIETPSVSRNHDSPKKLKLQKERTEKKEIKSESNTTTKTCQIDDTNYRAKESKLIPHEHENLAPILKPQADTRTKEKRTTIKTECETKPPMKDKSNNKFTPNEKKNEETNISLELHSSSAQAKTCIDDDKKEESSKVPDNNGGTEGSTEEEEEDISGMRAMRKETDNKFENMEAEFEAGRSKLAALRARIRKAREMANSSSD